MKTERRRIPKRIILRPVITSSFAQTWDKKKKRSCVQYMLYLELEDFIMYFIHTFIHSIIVKFSRYCSAY